MSQVWLGKQLFDDLNEEEQNNLKEMFKHQKQNMFKRLSIKYINDKTKDDVKQISIITDKMYEYV